MAKKISKFFLIASFLAILVLPAKTYAVDWFPIVPCGLNQQPTNATRMDTLPDGTRVLHNYKQDCNQCLLVELGKNIIDMTFFAIVPAVGTLMFMIAGFIILFNAREGKPAGVETGKKIMWDTAIGIAIILCSWLITNFILKSLAPNQAAGVCLQNGTCDTDTSITCTTNDQCPGTAWYQIQCRTDTLQNLVNATSPSRTPTATPPTGSGTPTPTVSTGPGAQCLQSGLNLCQGASSTGCANSMCGQYSAMIDRQAAATGVAANTLKSFMEIESSCNIAAGSGTSYGLMQLSPATANMYAYRCGVPSVNQTWLTTPANAEKSICIAAQFINAIAQSQCGSSIRNLYAGYNGGASATGACAPSVSCASNTSCSGEPVKKWECLYDDPAHTRCNGGTNIMAGYNQTRLGATKIMFCAANPGF